jgi:hypothetical protein
MYNGISCSDRKMNITNADTQRNGQLRENKIKMKGGNSREWKNTKINNKKKKEKNMEVF